MPNLNLYDPHTWEKVISFDEIEKHKVVVASLEDIEERSRPVAKVMLRDPQSIEEQKAKHVNDIKKAY